MQPSGFSTRLYFFIASVLIVIAVLIPLPFELSAASGITPVVSAVNTNGGTAADKAPDAAAQAERLVLEPGSSLSGLLTGAGMSGGDVSALADAIEPELDPRRIRSGQTVELTRDTGGRIETVSLPVSYNRRVVVRRADNRWTGGSVSVDTQVRSVRAEAVVESSLYAAALESGIPLSVMMEAIGLFGFNVDFQRDIRSGNRVTLIYDEVLDGGGERVAAGELLYARLDLDGRSTAAWRYRRLDGQTDYYEPSGESVRKSLLKTPVDGARVSSGYGYRNHPVLGFSDLHTGIDFAVAAGTPVMASGDGTVVLAGWHNQYGNRVMIRHANHYDTMYAHFSAIAAGILPGRTVAQGDIVGYVGSTGLSTGPHCHYEVHYYGRPVNPAGLKFPPGHHLDADDLALFTAERLGLMSEFGI